MNIETKFYNKRILDLWSTFWGKEFHKDKYKKYESILRRKPLTYPFLIKAELLFIGINPSFNEAKILSPHIKECYKNYEYYLSDSEIKKKFDELTSANRTAWRKGSPYSSELIKVSEYLGNMNWEHVDMFYIRETSHSTVKRILKLNENFKNDQIKLTCEIIEKIDPKIIIVNNAYVSELFRKGLIFSSSYNKELLTYTCEINGIEVLVFFTGMLSGGATDKESKKRLIWHVKMCKDARETFKILSRKIDIFP